MPRLIIRRTREGPVEREAEFDAPVLRIGRDSQNDLVLEASGSDLWVSRFHAEIRRDGPDYTVVDRESTNGTFVDRRQISSAPLLPGTTIEIGPFFLEFQPEFEGRPSARPAVAPNTVFDPVIAASDVHVPGAPLPPVRGGLPYDPRASRTRAKALLLGGTALAIATFLGVVRYQQERRITAPPAPSRQTIQEHLAEARRLLDQGDSDAARRELDEVFAADPTNEQGAAMRKAIDLTR
jgi:pSer/pThr/pTyr-binding forkhead associated (FHA) protein